MNLCMGLVHNCISVIAIFGGFKEQLCQPYGRTQEILYISTLIVNINLCESHSCYHDCIHRLANLYRNLRPHKTTYLQTVCHCDKLIFAGSIHLI